MSTYKLSNLTVTNLISTGTTSFTNMVTTHDSVGTTQTISVTAQNTTHATNGAQQYSPIIELIGQGWGTSGGGANEQVKIGLQVRPTQTTHPISELVLWKSINGASYSEMWSFFDSGTLRYSGAGPFFTISPVTQTTVGGTGKRTTVNGGQGGVADASVPGGVGGDLRLTAGTGGTGSSSWQPGNGGGFILAAGSGGGNALFPANGGNGIINAGAATGGGTNGDLFIGQSNTGIVNIGNSLAVFDYPNGRLTMQGNIDFESVNTFDIGYLAPVRTGYFGTSVITPTIDRADAGTLTLGGTATIIAPSTDGYVSLGDSSHEWKDGYFSHSVVIDGYTINPAGATTNDILKYNGTAFVPSAAGGGSVDGLKEAYESASSVAQNIIGLATSAGSIIIRDNSTPFADRLFSITDSADTIEYFSIYSTGAIISQAANSGFPVQTLSLLPGAHTAIQASTESIDFSITGREVTWASGAIATQRFNIFGQNTASFAGASTATTAATLAIEGAPLEGTNATITNAYALWIQSGKSQFDDDVGITGIATIPAISGATVITVNSIASAGDTGRTYGLFLNNSTVGSDQDSPAIRFSNNIFNEGDASSFWSIQSRTNLANDGYLSFDYSANGTSWTQAMQLNNNGIITIPSTIIASAIKPTIAAGTALGINSSPSVAIVGTANYGTITLVTGSDNGSGTEMAILTNAASYTFPNGMAVQITYADNATATFLNQFVNGSGPLYVTTTTGGWKIESRTAIAFTSFGQKTLILHYRADGW